MSNVYVSEPPPKGKLVFNTSHGELEIELWSKETPKACRNFVQLCLEGYYDNTIFHRIIPNFMIQGGDPTGTGTGGESIYGKPFIDEFHSRLRFTHRGLLAMANAGRNDNGSQFFITLDACPHLDRKHTIFGRVAGDTIFNIIRMSELETDANDRPLVPPKILGAEVIWNPFDDIIPRSLPRERKEMEDQKEREKFKSKARAIRNKNLLSFGDEDEEEEEVVSATIASSHDVLNDPKLSKEPAIAQEVLQENIRKKQKEKEDENLKRKRALDSVKKVTRSEEKRENGAGNESQVLDEKLRQSILERRQKFARQLDSDEDMSDSEEGDEQSAEKSKTAKKADPLKFKKKRKREDGEQKLSLVEEQRMKYLKRKQLNVSREKNTMEKLESFKKKLKNTLKGGESTELKWTQHRLKFEKEDLNVTDEPTIDHYVVLDPLDPKYKEIEEQYEKNKSKRSSKAAKGDTRRKERRRSRSAERGRRKRSRSQDSDEVVSKSRKKYRES